MIFRKFTRHSAVFFLFISCLGFLYLSGCKKKEVEQSDQKIAALDSAFANCGFWLNPKYAYKVRPYLDSVYSLVYPVSNRYLIQKYHLLADMHIYQTRKFALAEIYIDSIAVVLSKCPDFVDERIQFYFIKGNLAVELKQFDKAFDSYYKGKYLIDSIGDECKGLAYANSIAYLLYKQEQYSEALKYFIIRREWNLRCPNSDSIIRNYTKIADFNEIGLCYEKLSIYDSALVNYDRSISLFFEFWKKSENKGKRLLRTYAVVLGNKGSCLLKMKRYDSAEVSLKQSIAINFKPEREIADAMLNKVKLADVYLQTDRTQECKNMISDVENDLQQHADILVEMRLTELQYRYSLKNNDFKNALKFLQRNYVLKDSITNSSYKVDSRYNYKQEFDVLRQEMEVVKLQKLNSTKTFYIIIFSFALLGGLGIGLVLFKKRIAQNKHLAELKQLNEQITKNNLQLQNSLTSLEQSQSENSRIMKIVAHDLRSPLTGILGMVQLAKSDEFSSEERNLYFGMLEDSCKNALTFIDDLLFSSETNSIIQKEEADLAIILDSCLKLLKTQSDKKGIHLHSHIFSIVVNLNQEKIWRVFNNLLSNALKFSSSGKSIYLDLIENSDSVIVSVRDEGIGIPENLKDKIFDMFSTAGRAGTKGEKSFGLGLAISKQIVDAHKGKIWFESQENKGTTFYVMLPKLIG
jgi:signal transduction histidine kinase